MKCNFMVCITGPLEDRMKIKKELKRIPKPLELDPMLPSENNPRLYMQKDTLFFGGFTEFPPTLLFKDGSSSSFVAGSVFCRYAVVFGTEL